MTKINLRPFIKVFPFDETCSELINVLESKNFDVPQLEITFSDYGQGQYRKINTVKGNDFRLWFCRKQKQMGEWNDIAAVTDLIIGDISLSVYADGSGPTMNIYVGSNLHNDMQWWLANSRAINAKLLKEPRRSIHYEGSCSPNGGRYSYHHNEYLVQTTDSGRSYSPIELIENQIPHHSHKWSINQFKPTHDVPKCVLASDVFHYMNDELKKRLEIIKAS